MYQNKSVTGVIVAAGNSTRMGINVNKVYVSAGGRRVVQYSLDAFDRHPYVDDIVVVTRPEDRENLLELIGAARLRKPSRIVFGGETRKDSVYNAIAGLGSDIVVIHDGARPLIRESYITGCVETLDRCHGSVVAVPVTERICHSDGGTVRELDKSTLWAAQTPQCFYTRILRRCHEKHRSDPSITDDSSLLELEGYQVGIVPGDRSNIKITTPLDIPVAGVYLNHMRRDAAVGIRRQRGR